MNFLWPVLSLLIAINDVHTTFTKDTRCGETKGCFSDCSPECTYLIAWTNGTTAVTFTIQVELDTNADQYGAFGLSSSRSMEEASVTACIMTDSGGTFNYANSYNAAGYSRSPITSPTNGLSSLMAAYSNSVLTCTFDRTITNSDNKVFDLSIDYYILYAKGSGGITQHTASDRAVSSVKVDLQSNTDLGASEDELVRIKAHGGLAIMAWLCVINIGYIIARYYKPLWSGKKVLGADIWFLIHRIMMVSGAVLAITSFGVIIQGHFHVGENNFEKAHPYIGVLVFCFVIINPILGILRPDKASKYRPVFYWFHYCIGVVVIVLALTNIYIGIRLRKAATSRKAYYIFIAYEVFQIAMIIVLEVLRSKGIMANKGVNSDHEMKEFIGDQIDPGTSRLAIQRKPYAWTPKLILLCVHLVVTVSLSVAITGIVAGTSSSAD